MQKYLLIVAGSLILATVALAQPTITNGNFETWTVDAWSQDKAEPWSWYEINTTPPAFSKSTDAHGGSFALKIQNKLKEGKSANIKVVKTGAKLATRAKGFIKTSLGAGEKAIVEISAATTETNGTQVTTYLKTIGWQTFTGTSAGYVAIDIPLDYSLDQDVYYEKLDFQAYQIAIYAYDKFEDYFGHADVITANSYVIVDDFTLEGSVDPEYFVNAFPESFERWVEMDGHKYPYGWAALANPYKADYIAAVSQSTDAVDGQYALKYTLTEPGDFALVQSFANNGKKGLQVSLKYQLQPKDTVYVATFLSEKILLTITNESVSSYKHFVLDLTEVSAEDYIFFSLIKGSAAGTTSLLIDNLKLVDPTGLEDEYLNVSLVQVSPNPSSSGVFRLSNTNNASIQVSDVIGNKVAASLTNNGSESLVDLGAQPKGMYLINVAGRKTFKVQY